MKGPFGLVIAAGIAVLVIAIIFSLAPSVGGSIEDSNPNLAIEKSISLVNDTPIATGSRNIGNLIVSNSSTYATVLRDTTDYSYDSDVGSITLNKVAPNYDGTYYIKYDSSRWAASVNTDIDEGGSWYSENTTWITILFLGIIAVIILGMFMRW